jgi:hypothetical protein
MNGYAIHAPFRTLFFQHTGFAWPGCQTIARAHISFIWGTSGGEHAVKLNSYLFSLTQMGCQ